MKQTSTESVSIGLYPDGIYELSGLIQSALDQEITCLPEREVSEQGTRYPTDGASMRAFLEVFFTRHLFQVQNSLMGYVASPDFNRAISSGSFRILDIGSGPAVASLALIDVIHRMSSGAVPGTQQQGDSPRITHALNDTSAICLETGRHMVVACSRNTSMMKVECREQTLTQEVYPQRGQNETCTYTYYDCLYAPRAAFVGSALQLHHSQMRQLH